MIDWFTANYVAGADPSDPRISIPRAEDLRGVAPALVATAGFDPLRDEVEAYADALRKAGVAVLKRRFPGLVHGFFNAGGANPASRDARIEVAGITRGLLGAAADSGIHGR